MTPADLDALRLLCEEAAGAPWTAQHGEIRIPDGNRVASHVYPADAAFIAAARDALPRLLAEVTRLRDLACTSDEVGDFQAMRHAYRQLTSDLAAANVALDAALQLDIGNEKLIDVMMRRYGREATQWRANHAQRKDERDAALADLAAARAERDEAVEARSEGLRALEIYREACSTWLATKQALESERDAARAELATVKAALAAALKLMADSEGVERFRAAIERDTAEIRHHRARQLTSEDVHVVCIALNFFAGQHELGIEADHDAAHAVILSRRLALLGRLAGEK